MNIVLPYMGSKKRILYFIRKSIPENDLYIEPFAGGFSLGLQLIEEGLVTNAILNDIETKVTKFWTNLKDDYWSLVMAIDELVCIHGENINLLDSVKIKKLFNDTVIDDITSSALFYVYRKMNKGTSAEYISTNLNTRSMHYTDMFMRASDLLSSTRILNHSYTELKEYDNNTTFWYLDPPYVGYDNRLFYGEKCDEPFNHDKLAEFCKGLKGKFILSYDDTGIIRDLYKNFYIYPVKVRSKASHGGYSKELLISNFKLDIVEQDFSFHKSNNNVEKRGDLEIDLTLEDLFKGVDNY